MEQTWRTRANLRYEELNKLQEQAQDLKVRLGKDGAQQREITEIKIKLKSSLLSYEREYLRAIEYFSEVEQGQYFKLQMAVEELLMDFDIITELYQQDNDSSRTEIASRKLPKLELIKFDGNVQKWPEFWAKYDNAINKRKLSDVDKLSYLFTSLEGIALEAVRGIDVTNENYKVAVDILKNRFGDKDLVIDAHYNALNNLEKATDINYRMTLDTINKHLRILKTLGENTEGNFFRNIIYSKFPQNILYELNLILPKEKKLDRIMETLETIIQAKERSSEVLPEIASTSSSTTEALHIKTFIRKPLKRKFPEKKEYIKAKSSKRECTFCGNGHYDDQCQVYKTRDLRCKRLSAKRLCFKCFGPNHLAKRCRNQVSCFHCKGGHNRALCRKNEVPMEYNRRENVPIKYNKNGREVSKKYNDKKKVSGDSKDTPEKQGEINTQEGEKELSKVLQANAISYLQTATAQLKYKEQILPLRLLLDSGSQRSYLTENVARQLKIIPDKYDQLVIYTFGSNTPQESTSPSAKVSLITKRGVEKQLRVNIVPHITDSVKVTYLAPSNEIDVSADDDSLGERVDLLIGNDFYYSFFKNQSVEIQEDLHLIDTDFGWIISGHIMKDKDLPTELSVITYCQCHGSDCPYFTEPDLPLRNIDMRFLWSLECIGIVDSPKANREEEAVKYFNNTIKFNNGRYEVKWPWIEYPPTLPSNFGLAFGRLKSVLRRSDIDTLKVYQETLEEQLTAGVIELVDPQTISIQRGSHPIHYLPYHMIHQEGKKGRLVYDASAKMKEERSLNECMYRGPSMLEDLTALLLQFRTGKYGLIADVEKAFLQVGLQEEDRDVTRFLWVKNIDKEPSEENLLYYRFCRVPFGIISSPFLLNATIRYHLSNTNEELLKKIASKCYVDNLVTKADSLPEAIHLYSQTRKTFEEMSMNIRDWMTNDRTFLESIPENIRAKPGEEYKVLGLIWNIDSDTLRLKVFTKYDTESMEGKVTKRDVLRTLARVYDPCGFVSPWILPIKLVFQETCISKLKWETVLPRTLQESWLHSLAHLQEVKDIQLPRYVNNELYGTRCKYEIHCFADASKDAYSAVTYLVVRNKDKATTSFLMSKSRMTPAEDKDDLKIPRLELLGYLIASRLLKYVSDNIDLKIDKKCLWTDSLIVLAWMKTSKLLPPFVSRRVNEIKQHKDVEMRYVPTLQNPADIATRPEIINQKRDLWFFGPCFLTKDEEAWPHQHDRGENILFSVGESLDCVDGPEMSNKGYETEEDIVREIHTSELSDTIKNQEEIRQVQTSFFPEELAGKNTSLARNLGLFLDDNGILRCKGRLLNTGWSYNMKYPILIPKDSEFTEKVIQQLHEENYHVGVPHTLSLVRKTYWIPQGRAKVQKTLKKCPRCIKHGGGPYKLPPTPAWPAERVNYSSPFTYIGMDYFGPVFVQTASYGKEKRWVCLFTCLAVRAIHLEVVRDLTAEEGLMGLKRFIATRGKPNLIVSDNATQFKLMSEVLSGQDLRWKFIPQLAPWHGGVYERLIGLVKHCLRRTLDKHLLQDGQLITVIKEVEAVVNSRPLTSVGADMEQVLRPSDFLSLGKCVELHSPQDLHLDGTITKVDLIKSWKRGQKILNEFKDMFQGQYLLSLRERYKHQMKQPRSTSDREPRVNDVVQIKGDSRNRNNWKVGRISSLMKGSDGQCRVAKVKIGGQEFTRSVGHLYPLEADYEDQEVSTAPTGRMRDESSQLRGCLFQDETSNENIPSVSEPSRLTDDVESFEPRDPSGDMLVDGSSSSTESNPVSKEILKNESVESDPLEVSSSESLDLAEAKKPKINREAAIRAREKIAEWTRHLLTVL